MDEVFDSALRETAERILPLLMWHPAACSGERFDVNQPDLDAVLADCRPPEG